MLTHKMFGPSNCNNRKSIMVGYEVYSTCNSTQTCSILQNKNKKKVQLYSRLSTEGPGFKILN